MPLEGDGVQPADANADAHADGLDALRRPEVTRAAPARLCGAAGAAQFDPDDARVRNDIVQVIVQYLQEEGFTASSLIVQDEANVRLKNTSNKRSQLKRVRRAVMAGAWDEVEEILAQKAGTFRHQSHFLYAVHRQHFLELIDAGQAAKALFLMQKKLKPLERFAPSHNDFRALAYLLTCHSVTESDDFSDWDGANASRAALVDQCARLLDLESFLGDPGSTASVRGLAAGGAGASTRPKDFPPSRLVSLIRQAVLYQVETSMYRPAAPPRVDTILEDFECAVVPNVRQRTFVGHTANVKCVAFVGTEGDALVTGSSDNTARVWGTHSGEVLAVLKGHRSRIWDVSTSASGSLVATAGADGTVRVWNTSSLLDRARTTPAAGAAPSPHAATPPALTPARASCTSLTRADAADSAHSRAGSTVVTDDTLRAGVRRREAVLKPACTLGRAGGADQYAVALRADGAMALAGGYDNEVRLYDVQAQRVVHVFSGHESAVSCVGFNARGTVAITGGRDATVRYWDVLSGLCVQTLSSHLGEVTSVAANAAGTLLLTASKDNSNRVWDVRKGRPLRRLKGHQNTSKNFVRAAFGPMERLVLGASEDGFVYIWDVDTTDVVGKLGPAHAAVYAAQWNARQSLLVSCSHDGSASTWCYDRDAPPTV